MKKTPPSNGKLAALLARMAERIVITDEPDERPPLTAPDFSLCPVCGGFGVFKYDVPYDDSRFGKMFPCDNPKCEKAAEDRERRSEAMLTRSGVPGEYRFLTFATFYELPPEKRDGKETAAAALLDMLDNAANGFYIQMTDDGEPPRNSLVLSGPLGVGKTGLCCAFVNEGIARGIPMTYYRAQALFDEIQRRYDAANDTDEQRAITALTGVPYSATDVLDHIKDTPVLVIDEMTVPAASADKLRIIEDLIRHRMAAARPTVITTNHDTNAFRKQWGDRAADPVFAMSYWLEITGERLRRDAVIIRGN
jgi:DNA replication protein DnaC